MINKNNWKLTKKYLNDRWNSGDLVVGSWKLEQTCLRYLLEWADNESFVNAPTIIPTFQIYLRSARLDGKDNPISPEHRKKILATARRFFLWLIENEREFKKIKISWVNKIKVKSIEESHQTKEYVTLDEIKRIAKAPAETVQERRIRAAAVIMYLTGIRIGALVSLRIKAVDLVNRYIYQYTSLGVHTKLNKNDRTVIFNIQELIEVCKAWDEEIKQTLDEDGFWFAPLSPETGEINPDCKERNDTRVMIVRRDLKRWLQKVGLPYHSPHKFRHGNIHLGQANSTNKEEYKALSQNVMHSSTLITDKFYSNLDDDKRKESIDLMVSRIEKPQNTDNELEEFRQFLEWKRLKTK